MLNLDEAEDILRGKPQRRGFTILELLIGLTLSAFIVGVAFGIHRFAVTSTQQVVAPETAVQIASRMALLKLLKELKSSIEIVRPPQGASLSYFLARDDRNRLMLGYQVIDPVATRREGRVLHALYLYRYEHEGRYDPDRDLKLMDGIERLTFTTLGSGVLQFHAHLFEGGRTYEVLTSVRTRNICADMVL